MGFTAHQHKKAEYAIKYTSNMQKVLNEWTAVFIGLMILIYVYRTTDLNWDGLHLSYVLSRYDGHLTLNAPSATAYEKSLPFLICLSRFL